MLNNFTEVTKYVPADKFEQVFCNSATIVMFGVVPISIYWALPYIAFVVRTLVNQIVDIVAQTHENFSSTLKLMRRKCVTRKSYMYRKLRASPNLGLHIFLGASPHLVKNSFKIEYRSNVLYYTVSLIMAT